MPATQALEGLDPADLLRQGVAGETFVEDQPPFSPPSLEELAAIFPQFEMLGLIGQGGMAAVYKVRQRELQRIAALKILPPAIGGQAGFAGRFTREARALAQLNHPGIVTLYESGQAGGLYYFLMEYVDGVNLRQLLRQGPIAPREAMAIVPQICDALQFAHDQGIVHRDIKPENLLLDRRGRAKIADFGIAKLVEGESTESPVDGGNSGGPFVTETGKVMGTPDYMAPEQLARPEEVDHRADIYAVGVVFYQMLTGELPGKPLAAPSKKIQVDVRLDEVVLRTLEELPGRRYQQAGEVKTRVETIAGSPAAPARSKWRRLARIAVGACVLVFLLTLVAVLLPRMMRTAPEPPQSAAATPPDLSFELALAHKKRDLQKTRYEAGLASVLEFEDADDAVKLLEARQTGDPVAIAEAGHTAAARRLTRSEQLFSAGHLTAADLEIARDAARVATKRYLKVLTERSPDSLIPAPAPPSEPPVSAPPGDPGQDPAVAPSPKSSSFQSQPSPELASARKERDLQQTRYEAGIASVLQFEEADDAVRLLEARQTGDPVAIAEAGRAAATRRLTHKKQLFAAGTLTAVDLMTAQNATLEATKLYLQALAQLPPGRLALTEPTERILSAPLEDLDHAALDLDQGLFIAPPEALRTAFAQDDSARTDWLSISGADLTSTTWESSYLTFWGGFLSDISPPTDPPTASEVLEAASQGLALQSPEMASTASFAPGVNAGGGSMTFVTRQGSVGLFRVLESMESPYRVKIQYRLVKRLDGPSSSPPTR